MTIVQQRTKLASNKSSLPMDNIYSSKGKIEDSDSFSSDDNIPLANFKAKKFRSPFQELLPSPNYDVKKISLGEELLIIKANELRKTYSKNEKH
ncbi:unnamed protein product [Acanthoscelides obtectus]|uniref:Uncharacterized protein n=1 Tax=Acanthoscelides obtectus TaxID=200917 RepID=A0A9P0JW12_ACAOB|nr:unnamed protein product [Acanthoscelides obtectus]CAK1647084.1 hypothetical protein AOBTE_LOCUS15036 [Acanthoscelides obtectus]